MHFPPAPEFYGIVWIISRSFMEQFPPSIFMTYKPCAEARKFYGKVWTIFRNFMEIPPTALGHHSPLLISLIPGARNFMELYGLFMEILWKNLAPILDLYEASRENLWKIHGFLWKILWKTYGMADP
jgi:hypothetical protein